MRRQTSRPSRTVGVLLAMTAMIAAVALNVRTTGAATARFTPVADTYVEDATPSENYGTTPRIVADNAPMRRAFLKFTVRGVSGTVTEARLRLHVRDVAWAESGNGGTLSSMSATTWSEDEVTWDNQPIIDGDRLGSVGAVSIDTWYDIDVTPAITGNGTFSFGITSPDSNAAHFDSREAGANSPQLVVTAVPTTTSTSPPTTAPVSDPVLVGAGDVAGCSSPGDEATADLLDGIAGTVFTAGDNAYPDATAAEFANCYEPSWGRHKARTRPSPGNHDYKTADAGPYFDYFGAKAGDPDKGYYSYDLGNWHVIAVNSNCSSIGGCDAGSPQEQWLRADLAASTKPCTIAYWHDPVFTSGSNHEPSTEMRPIFEALYDHDAEVVVGGHNHNYERFAPQAPNGALDKNRGIRQFVVGTGGIGFYSFGTIQPNSQARNSDTFGVLKLTLRAESYDWEFVPEAGKTYTDSGSTACH